MNRDNGKSVKAAKEKKEVQSDIVGTPVGGKEDMIIFFQKVGLHKDCKSLRVREKLIPR